MSLLRRKMEAAKADEAAQQSSPDSLAMSYDMQRRNRKKMAKGGMVRDIAPEMAEDDGMPMDMSDRIMRRRMAKGGMIDLPEQEAEHASIYDDLNEEALDEQFDDSPEADSMHDMEPDLQEDVVDHLDRIMNRMSKKPRR